MFYSPQGGGVRRYLSAKRTFLSAQDHCRHTLVVPGAPDSRPPLVPGLPLPLSYGYRVALGRRSASRVLIALRPDIIEAGDPYQLAWAALDAGRATGVPVVGFYHSDLPELAAALFGMPGRMAANAYVRRLYRQFDTVFAPSRSAVAALREVGLDHVVHQPLGVDTTTFRPGQRNPQWRRRLDIAADDCVLLYVGRYAPEKNLTILRDAVRLLGSGHVLVTIGSGPCAISGPRLRVLEHQQDANALIEAITSADIFVHAGIRETFGLAVLEALACGVPVVACAQGGLADLIDGTVGEVVPHCTAKAFAAAINALRYRDPVPVSRAARQRALRYDWQLVLSSLLGHYRQLVSATEAGPAFADGRAERLN